MNNVLTDDDVLQKLHSSGLEYTIKKSHAPISDKLASANVTYSYSYALPRIELVIMYKNMNIISNGYSLTQAYINLLAEIDYLKGILVGSNNE